MDYTESVFQENSLGIMRINVLRRGSRSHHLTELGLTPISMTNIMIYLTVCSPGLSSHHLHHLVFCTRWLSKCLCNHSSMCLRLYTRDSLFHLEPVWIFNIKVWQQEPCVTRVFLSLELNLGIADGAEMLSSHTRHLAYVQQKDRHRLLLSTAAD